MIDTIPKGNVQNSIITDVCSKLGEQNLFSHLRNHVLEDLFSRNQESLLIKETCTKIYI